MDDAERIVAHEIQKFAVANGAPKRYHDTMTRFWVRLVGHAMENAPDAGSIDALLAMFPVLLDKTLSLSSLVQRDLQLGSGACWLG
jgi:hypothetical protein